MSALDSYLKRRRERRSIEAGDPQDRLVDVVLLEIERRKEHASPPTLRSLMTVFFAGAAYEAGCVVWVHASEANSIALASVFSCINAVVTVIGVEGFLKSRAGKIAYVLGFGAGTLLAMMVRRWM